MKNSFRFLTLIVSLGLIMTLSSCDTKKESKVLDENINIDNIMKVADKLENDPNITNEEIILFSTALGRISTTKDSLEGKTVRDIIENQRAIVKKNNLKNIRNIAMRMKMDNAMGYSFNKMFRADTLDKKMNVLNFDLINKSDKDIQKVEGYINVVNQQNQLLKRFPVSVEKTIPAGKKATVQSNPYVHDPDNRSDRIIRNNQVKKNAIWQAVMIEFADGTKLQNEDQ